MLGVYLVFLMISLVICIGWFYLSNSVTEHDNVYKRNIKLLLLGIVLSILWPITLILLIFYGIGFLLFKKIMN